MESDTSILTQVFEKIYERGYKVGEFIDKGGQGTIFRATNTNSQDNSEVVIKLIKMTRNNQIMTKREIKYLSKFQTSSTIINLIENFNFTVEEEEKEQFYEVLVLEKMDTDLMTYLIPKEALSMEEGKQIFRHICLAVKECHDKGIAHLDLKPDNILLKFGETLRENSEEMEISKVKLADFGHCHDINDVTVPKKIGTKYYVPPEVRLCNSNYLPFSFQGDKSDIFSLGVTLFTMLAGVYPFRYHRNGELKSNMFTHYCDVWDDDDLVDLLESIFYARRTCDRPSIDRILNHKWVQPSREVISPRFAS